MIMELVMNNQFCEMSLDDALMIDGGSWTNFAYALGGTLLIASSPIIACAPGGGWIVACGTLGSGIAMIGNCK